MYIYSELKDTITGISDPEKVMKELNRRMYQLQMPDHLINYYFTAIYLVLDTEKQTIEYVNAGHPAGIAIVDDEVKLLTEGCCALGFFEDIDVTKGVIPYKRGARTLLFTDGLSEWLEEDYGDAIARLISTLQEKDMDNPDSFLHQLQPSMEPHNAPKDDLCLVMISTNV